MVEKVILKNTYNVKCIKKHTIEKSSYLVECAENKVDENNNETNISEMPDLLLKVGMDGPNVKLKFEKDLAHHISDSYGVSYIKLGSCVLHQTHNAFRKAILIKKRAKLRKQTE